jgi:hypothetical protein
LRVVDVVVIIEEIIAGKAIMLKRVICGAKSFSVFEFEAAR